MAKVGQKRSEVTTPEFNSDLVIVNQQTNRIALTVQEFCRAIGLGKTTVNALIKDGTLRSFRVRGRRLIPTAEFVDFPNRMSGK